MKRGILLIGAFDTKPDEYLFVKNLIENQKFNVITMNWGVLGTTDLFKPDIENREVAEAGGENSQADEAAHPGRGGHEGGPAR